MPKLGPGCPGPGPLMGPLVPGGPLGLIIPGCPCPYPATSTNTHHALHIKESV